MGRQISAGSLRSGQITEAELKRQSERFLRGFVQALKSGDMDDVTGAAWGPVRELLGEFSRARRAGIYARGNGDLRLLLEGTAVRAPAQRDQG